MRWLTIFNLIGAFLVGVLYSCGEPENGATVIVHSISVDAKQVRSPVRVDAVLSASKQTVAWFELRYLVDTENQWKKCSVVGGSGFWGIEVGPSQVNYYSKWDALQDIGEGEFTVKIALFFDNKLVAQTAPFTVITDDKPPTVEVISEVPYSVNNNTVFELVAHDDKDTNITVKAEAVIANSRKIVSFVDAAGVEHSQIVLPTETPKRFKLLFNHFEPGVYRGVKLLFAPYDTLGNGKALQLLRNLEVLPTQTLKCFAPVGIQRGVVQVSCVIYGGNNDFFSVDAYYRDPLRPETDWIHAITEPMPLISASSVGTVFVVSWLSAKNLPFYAADGVEFEVRANPGNLRSRVEFALNNAPAIEFAALSEVFVGTDNTPTFIEIYGAPGASLAGYALLEVRRDGQYDRTRQRGFLLFDEGVEIPEDGFLVISSQEEEWADVVDEQVSTFFRFGFPTNLLLIKPLDKPEFYQPDKTPTVDAVAFGEFSAADVFAGRCQFTKQKAQEQGETLEVCPPSSAAPTPESGESACRKVSNLDLGENRIDWAVCAQPTPGTGYLLRNED